MGETDGLDYCVFEMAEPSERDVFVASSVKLEDKHPVVIMHHPAGHDGPLPLQNSYGAIRDVNLHKSTFGYTAATAPGSSGAPVLSGRYELIGLHYHQQRGVNSHAVPIAPIAADLKAKGFPWLQRLETPE